MPKFRRNDQNLKNKNFQAGFTLIEILLYLALFGIIFTAVIEFLIAIVQNNQIAEERQGIESTVIFLNEHFSHNFKTSQNLDQTNSILASNNSKLVLINTSSNTPTYELNSERLQYTEGGISDYLTKPGILVSQLLAEQILDANNNIIGIRLTVRLYSEKTPRLNRTYTTSYLFKN